MPVVVLHGPPRGGKTSRAIEVVQRARRRLWCPAGFVAHGTFHDGSRSGFDLEELDTGRRTALSRAADRPLAAIDIEFGADGSERVGRFTLSVAGLEAGRQALRRAAAGDADLVIVDEVGWLELEGGGWDTALRGVIECSGGAVVVLIVRDELVARVRARYGLSEVVVLRADEPDAADRIEAMMEARR